MAALLSVLLPYVVPLCVTIAGLLAYRHMYGKETVQLQERVTTLLKAENETLENRVRTLEKESTRQKLITSTIRAALKRRGLHIEINGEYISITDIGNRKTTTVTIHENGEEEESVSLPEQPKEQKP